MLKFIICPELRDINLYYVTLKTGFDDGTDRDNGLDICLEQGWRISAASVKRLSINFKLQNFQMRAKITAIKPIGYMKQGL